MRRFVTPLVAGTVAVAFFVAASPASADITEPAGRCAGQASFANGVDGPFTVSSTDLQSGDVTTIPLEDTVTWTGKLSGAVSGSREISGFLKIDMPWPIPDITLNDWGGTSSRTENADTTDYSLPSITPRGVELRVYGEHREAGSVFCSGSTKVKLEGSSFGPFAIASVVLLAASALVAAVASKKASPGLGTAAGFFTLLFLALALVFLGVLPLNSPLVTALPVLGLPLGFAWGKAAFLGAKVAATP
jgi:hypothetical protein